MSHRIDLKMLGYKGIKYGSKEEITTLAKLRQAPSKKQRIVKTLFKDPNKAYELYEKMTKTK